MADGILTERIGKTTIFRIDNPPAMNAMTPATAGALAQMLSDEAQVACAIILAGHPHAFCSGVALTADLHPSDQNYDAGAALELAFNPLMRSIKDCRVPIVSAVRGAAAGVGAAIALACDIIVAGRSAYFLQAFGRIGLVPDGGSAYLLAHSIGRVRAMELMLLGDRLSAETALQWGLINRVVEDDAVEEVALDIASRLADGPTETLSMIRKLAWSALAAGWECQLEAERALQRQAGVTHSHREGVAAFLEKRKPVFR